MELEVRDWRCGYCKARLQCLTKKYAQCRPWKDFKPIEKLRKKINKVHHEYLQRLDRIEKTGHGCTSDHLMNCPFCGSWRGMECSRGHWQCLWRDCLKTIDLSLLD